MDNDRYMSRFSVMMKYVTVFHRAVFVTEREDSARRLCWHDRAGQAITDLFETEENKDVILYLLSDLETTGTNVRSRKAICTAAFFTPLRSRLDENDQTTSSFGIVKLGRERRLGGALLQQPLPALSLPRCRFSVCDVLSLPSHFM